MRLQGFASRASIGVLMWVRGDQGGEEGGDEKDISLPLQLLEQCAPSKSVSIEVILEHLGMFIYLILGRFCQIRWRSGVWAGGIWTKGAGSIRFRFRFRLQALCHPKWSATSLFLSQLFNVRRLSNTIFPFQMHRRYL